MTFMDSFKVLGLNNACINTQDDVHILCKLNVDCYLKTLEIPHKNAEHLKTIY